MPNRKKWLEWHGAAVLGAATVLGFAPFGLFPLPFATLALLFRAWRGAATPWRAAQTGYVWGLGFFLAGVSWIYVSLNQFGDMAPPLAAVATLLFCAVLAAFPALAGFAFARYRGGTAGGDALLAAGLWALTEWLRGWIFTGFPWLALGYSPSRADAVVSHRPGALRHLAGTVRRARWRVAAGVCRAHLPPLMKQLRYKAVEQKTLSSP